MLCSYHTPKNNDNNNKGDGGNFGKLNMDMFMSLMVVMISGVYTYPQTNRAVYIKYVPLLKNFLINLFIFIYFWLCWVFVSVQGLSLVAASGDHSSSWCAGLSLSRPLLLRSTGSRRAGSIVVVHGPSCSAACGIFPDQGLNQCPLHRQADSQPLRHQGSPCTTFYMSIAPQKKWFKKKIK